MPRASRCAILWNAAGAVEVRVREARNALRTLGMTPLPFEVRDLAGFENAFARMRTERADTLVVIADPLTLRHRQVIVDLAARDRIPAVYEFAEFARAGGLIAYSADVPALFQRAAVYVDKILKGAKPSDLPVEQPTTFRIGDQPEDRQGARPHDPAVAAAARRRGDPVSADQGSDE